MRMSGCRPCLPTSRTFGVRLKRLAGEKESTVRSGARARPYSHQCFHSLRVGRKKCGATSSACTRAVFIRLIDIRAGHNRRVAQVAQNSQVISRTRSLSLSLSLSLSVAAVRNGGHRKFYVVAGYYDLRTTHSSSAGRGVFTLIAGGSNEFKQLGSTEPGVRDSQVAVSIADASRSAVSIEDSRGSPDCGRTPRGRRPWWSGRRRDRCAQCSRGTTEFEPKPARAKCSRRGYSPV